MKIRIQVKEDDEDRLMPWLGKADIGGIECRGHDPATALASVKGTVLCFLGCWENPPDRIEFLGTIEKSESSED